MEFITNKCHVVRYGDIKKRPIHQHKLGEIDIRYVNQREKKLGILVNSNVNPEVHNNGRIYKMLL